MNTGWLRIEPDDSVDNDDALCYEDIDWSEFDKAMLDYLAQKLEE